MLKALRKKKTAKKIWIVLAILIMPAFIFWGFGYALRGQKDPKYAGKINGKPVSFIEYREAYNAVRNQYKLQFGRNLYKFEKYLDLPSQSLERIALLKEAAKRRIKADNKEVIDFIQKIPYFQPNGVFNNALYEQALRYDLGTHARIFEEQMRQQVILTKLFKEIAKDVSVSDEETKNAFKKENESLSLYYIAALSADFAKDISLSEEEIKDYYQKNSLQFKQPLSFNIEYVVFDAEKPADDFALRLNKKEDFNTIAKEMNIAVKETGLFPQMGPIPSMGWNPDLLSTLSKAKLQEIIGPAAIDKNYYIIRLKERKEPRIPELEEINDKVKQSLINDRAKQVAREMLNKCLEKLQNSSLPAEFDSIAQTFSLKEATTNSFKFGSYIEGIGMSDPFWNAAEKLKGDAWSELIETPAGFYTVRLKERQAMDEKKYETEKVALKERLLSQKQEESFSKYLQNLKKSIVINLPLSS